MLTNIDEESVNKSNVPLELQKLHSKDLLFFNDGSWNLSIGTKLIQDAMKRQSSYIDNPAENSGDFGRYFLTF